MTQQKLKKSSKMTKNDQESSKIVYTNSRNGCPNCKADGSNFMVEGRCVTCRNCGWSKCYV